METAGSASLEHVTVSDVLFYLSWQQINDRLGSRQAGYATFSFYNSSAPLVAIVAHGFSVPVWEGIYLFLYIDYIRNQGQSVGGQHYTHQADKIELP